MGRTTTTLSSSVNVSNGNVVSMSNDFRLKLKQLEAEARVFIKLIKDSDESLYDKGECIADATIAMRHIEDARMRYGKVIQYATTGESPN